jgi:hypothetical protein
MSRSLRLTLYTWAAMSRSRLQAFDLSVVTSPAAQTRERMLRHIARIGANLVHNLVLILVMNNSTLLLGVGISGGRRKSLHILCLTYKSKSVSNVYTCHKSEYRFIMVACMCLSSVILSTSPLES